MNPPTKTPLRERLKRLGPFTGEGDFLYSGDTRCSVWHVGCVYRGLDNVPAAELAALIAKLLNEYVNTPAAS